MGRASRGVGTDAKTGAKGLDRLGASGLASSTALKAGVAAAATIAGAKLVAFGRDAIAAASAVQEQTQGAQVTFGAFADQVVDFADKSSGALGLSRSEALLAANAFGGLFKATGATPQSAADASLSFVRLAGDIASFKDVVGGVPVVLEKLRSGLSGEAEPLRTLGVFLNETSVKAKAAELGLGGVGRQLTDGEKIAARYALIIEQTADAQGDLERTSGSLANQQRKLSADIKRLQEDIGGGLVPAAQLAVVWFRSLVGGATKVGDAVTFVAAGFNDLSKDIDDTAAVSQELRDRWKGVIGDAKTVAEAQKNIGENVLIGGKAAAKEAGAFGALAKVLELGKEIHEEAADAVDKVTKATLATSSAQRAYAAASRQVASADRALTDARKDYNQLLKEGAVDEEKVVDARRSLNEATRSLASANRSLAKSQREYDEALAIADVLGTDTSLEALLDASDNLADAKDSVASASEREQEAQETLAQARAGDPEFNDKLADAKLRVTDAELGLATAQYGSAEAAYKLDEAMTEQNTLLATNASAVATIRSEWDALLKRKPEIEAFLAGPMAGLPTAPPPASEGPGTPTSSPPPGGLLVAPPAAGNLSPVITNNNTFNINEAVADPIIFARRVLWELN